MHYKEYFQIGVKATSTLGSRGYFFLMDTDGSRRSRVNEAQSAEEKKITSGHRSTQPHFHVISRSNMDMGVSNRWPSSNAELISRMEMRLRTPVTRGFFFSSPLFFALTRLHYR